MNSCTDKILTIKEKNIHNHLKDVTLCPPIFNSIDIYLDSFPLIFLDRFISQFLKVAVIKPLL